MAIGTRRKGISWLGELISAYEKASGVNILHGYGIDIPKIGEAVRMIMNSEKVLGRYRDDLRWVKSRAENIAAQVAKELEQLPADVEADELKS